MYLETLPFPSARDNAALERLRALRAERTPATPAHAVAGYADHDAYQYLEFDAFADDEACLWSDGDSDELDAVDPEPTPEPGDEAGDDAPERNGATRWSHFVLYCDSIQHAFNSLRHEVFFARQYRGDKTARSIYALRRGQGESGTHSILDMQWVSAEPGFETIAPLSPAQLIELFGSMRPTRAEVETAAMPQRPAWEGTYVIVYSDDRTPIEILFYGRSGR